MADAAPTSDAPEDAAAPRPDARGPIVSPRFVIGVGVSIVVHVGVLLLLTLPGARPGSPGTLDPPLLVEWQAVEQMMPTPARRSGPQRTDPLPRPRNDAPTPAPTKAESVAVDVDAPLPAQERGLATVATVPTQQSSAVAAPAAVASEAVATTPRAPTNHSGYLWDVLSHLQRFRRYPQRARRAGAEGTVLVQARISRAGAVLRASVALSSGNAALDRAASRLIEQASPLPPPPVGALAITDLRLPIEYRLHDL